VSPDFEEALVTAQIWVVQSDYRPGRRINNMFFKVEIITHLRQILHCAHRLIVGATDPVLKINKTAVFCSTVDYDSFIGMGKEASFILR
jgi:hypothetical protein